MEEAVFLDAIIFWYRTNRANANPAHFHDGRYWTYNSIKAFEEIFPWWNGGQIRRIIARCKDKGALLAGNYSSDQRDRTIWYSPSDELLALYGEAAEENCICRKQQMQETETAPTSAGNGKCNIRNSRRTHVEQNTVSPYSPPAGDTSTPASDPEDKPTPKPKRTRREKSAPDHDPEAFETFWAKYPRKDDRKAAIRAWDKLKPDKPLCRTMYDALKRQRGSEQWAEEGGKYIPLFSTWLNGRKWENQGVDLSLLTGSKGSGSYWSDAPGVDS